MNEQEYMKMLYVIDHYYEGDPIVLEWGTGLKIKCKSFTGIMETDTEPGEKDYIGEYSIGVNEIEILKHSQDDSVPIYDNSIEICLNCIPDKISSEDGTVLWQRK